MWILSAPVKKLENRGTKNLHCLNEIASLISDRPEIQNPRPIVFKSEMEHTFFSKKQHYLLEEGYILAILINFLPK